MSWIQEADLPDLPGVFRALSLDSQALGAVEQMNEDLAFGSSNLNRVQEEAIATVVSVANRYRYGALTHGGFYRRHSGNPETASWLLFDYTQASFPPKDRRMLDFAVKVTQDPASLTEVDVEGLRDSGFEDRDIVSIVLVTCLFNFMNRVASSLGVDVPEGFERSVKRWLTGPALQQTWLLRSAEARLLESATELGDAIGEPAEENPQGSVTPKTGVAGDAPLEAEAIITQQEDNPEQPTPKDGGEKASELGGEGYLEIFVAECCQVSDGEACTARDLYLAYIRWCDGVSRRPLLQRNFGLGLSVMGFQRKRQAHGQHWWHGINLDLGLAA